MSIASLGAMMRVKRLRMVLVVAPVSVLNGWTEEGRKFLPQFAQKARVLKVHGGKQTDRQKTIRNAWKASSPDHPFVIVSS